MHNLNAGVAGKSSLVEGKNAGEPVHPHGGDQPGIVRWLPEDLLLNDQALPNWINRRSIG
jgi:hypothetical protein